MWSKPAKLLIVRFKVKGRRGFVFPVSVWAVDEFFEALAGLAWIGEMALKWVPLSRKGEAKHRFHWVKAISPSGLVAGVHSIFKDLSSFKGLDFVNVELGDICFKISLK